MTRGHDIVANGWAGASNPNPHLTPFPTQTHTQKALKRSFFHFLSCVHGPTDGSMDGRTKPLIELRDRNKKVTIGKIVRKAKEGEGTGLNQNTKAVSNTEIKSAFKFYQPNTTQQETQDS